MAPLVLSFDGNIGSGKSTLVEEARKRLFGQNSKFFWDHKFKNIVFLQEPVDIWKTIVDETGVTILEKFYEDQKTWSFAFQMMAYISRLSILKKTIKENPNSLIITERCVHTDRNVFAKMLYDSKKINEIEYAIYLKWFDEFLEETPVHGIVYLDVTPETCFERIAKRAREGEAIPLEYLKECERYHKDWISNLDYSTTLFTLDGNPDSEKNPEIINLWIEQIEGFIYKRAAAAEALDAVSNLWIDTTPLQSINSDNI